MVLFLAILQPAVTTVAAHPANRPTLERITLTLTVPALQVATSDDGFDQPQIEGFYPSGAPGDPALPARIYNVAVPPDIAWESLSVEVLRAEILDWPGTYQVAPAPPAGTRLNGREIIDWGENVAKIVDGKNTAVYQNDAYYPATFVTPIDRSQMRKWRLVRLLLTPLQYNPASGKMRLATEIEIGVAFRRDPAVDPQRLQLELSDTVMDDRAAEMLYNYEQARTWYPTKSAAQGHEAGPGYVILTTNDIAANSSELDNFIAHKQAKGYTVEVVTESQYGGLTGQAPDGTAEKIRQWLIDNYLVKTIAYVLLIGNPDPDDPDDPSDAIGDVPMKMLLPRPTPSGDPCYDQVATDYIYADLTGNWDLNGDEVFGQFAAPPDGDNGAGGVDFSPEVYIGRIPVYTHVASWAADLDGILRKIIDYENSGDLTWRKTALLPMGYCRADTDGAHLSEHMQSDYLNGRGYSSYTIYQHQAVGCDSSFSSDQDLVDRAVRDHWGQQRYGIVTWFGHGGATGAGIGYDGCAGGTLLDSADTLALNDDHPAFVYQCSCLNGYPEHFDNLGYALLKRGAIGTVSSSRCSGYWIGSFYPGQDVDNARIGYYFIDRLTGGQSAGEALCLTKAVANHVELTSWINLMLFNLYGDPSTGVNSGHPWPPAAPSGLTAKAVQFSQVDLSWTDNSDNELGFRIWRSPSGTFWEEIDAVSPDNTGYLDTDDALACGTTYHYRVGAYNAYGSHDSGTVQVTALEPDMYEPDDTPATAGTLTANQPPQPRGFHADGDQDWVKIQMQAGWAYTMTTSYLSDQTDTVLELYDTDGTTKRAENDDCTVGSRNSCIKRWVAPATGTYYLRVLDKAGQGGCMGYGYGLSAVDSGGYAGWPVAPSDLAATPHGHNRIDLTWTDNSNNEDGFEIERWGVYHPPYVLPLWDQVATVGANVTQYSDTGLTCDKNHQYRVRAYNEDGDSAYSLVAGATTGAADAYEYDDYVGIAPWIAVNGPPQARTFHVADDEDWARFTMTAGKVYTVTTSNLGPESATILELYGADGLTRLSWNLHCPGVGKGSCIRWVASDTGQHTVRVRNISGEGGCPGYEYELAVAEGSGDPDQPAAPGNLSATATSHSQILLTWTDSSDNEEGFKVERWGYSLPPFTLPLWQQVFITGADVTSYVDNGLACNESYRYRVRAYNGDIDSGYSNTAQTTTATQDAYEPDEFAADAKVITVDGGPQSHNLHTPGDRDWVKFGAAAGQVYTITTSQLGTANDTFLELRDTDGVTVLLTNDDCTPRHPASCINGWVAPATGMYYVRVGAGEMGGCPGYEYDLTIVDSHLSDAVPAAPIHLTAVAASPTQIHLAWDTGRESQRVTGGSAGFKIERRYGIGWLQIGQVGPAVSRYSDAGLSCGLAYEYRVCAYNASGASDFVTTSASTAECPRVAIHIYLPIVLKGSGP